jgi:hypothetical protein
VLAGSLTFVRDDRKFNGRKKKEGTIYRAPTTGEKLWKKGRAEAPLLQGRKKPNQKMAM